LQSFFIPPENISWLQTCNVIFVKVSFVYKGTLNIGSHRKMLFQQEKLTKSLLSF